MSGRFFSTSKGAVDREKVLFVEGEDDAFFFDKLLDLKGADPNTVGIVYLHGKYKLDENIGIFKRTRLFQEGRPRKLAIVLDADASGQNALADVQRILRTHGLPAPNHGAFEQRAGSPDIGILIIPSVESDGDLEKICLGTLGDDPRLVRIEEFQEEYQQSFGRLDRIYKRRAAIFLACSKAETRGVGRAFQSSNLFDHGHQSLDEIKSFLDRFLT
jgi:hypothetical protein